jgi:type IX secretion system PorP/SprF family membrane protein
MRKLFPSGFRFFLSLSLIGFLPFFSWEQQLPQYSQWALHQFALNPAHAGIKPCIDIHALYRLQWLGFSGAPKSGIFTFTVPLKSPRKFYLSARQGIGFRVENDQIGSFNTNRVGVSYAAHFNFSRDTRLSLGINAGLLQMGYDPSKVTTVDPDPTISKEISFVAPDATFGAWWNGENYYAGMVISNLLRNRWLDLGTDARSRIHLALNGGVRIKLNEKATLLPSLLMKIPPKGPMALDVQAMVDFNNRLGIGLGYRNTDALVILVGIKFKQQVAIYYSYDLTTSALRNGSGGSHELSISFTGCKPEDKNKGRCALFE